MKMWIAREENHDLKLFEDKPIYHHIVEAWLTPYDYSFLGYLDEMEFPEVTFENSPIEVELKLIEK